jgi:hypothetical protein
VLVNPVLLLARGDDERPLFTLVEAIFIPLSLLAACVYVDWYGSGRATFSLYPVRPPARSPL